MGETEADLIADKIEALIDAKLAALQVKPERNVVDYNDPADRGIIVWSP